MAKYRGISIPTTDYEWYESILQKEQELQKTDLTMPKVIKKAMQLLAEGQE